MRIHSHRFFYLSFCVPHEILRDSGVLMAQKEGEVTYLRTADGNLTNVVADAGVLHVQWVTAQMDSSSWQEMPKEPSYLYFGEDMWAAELPTQVRLSP